MASDSGEDFAKDLDELAFLAFPTSLTVVRRSGKLVEVLVGNQVQCAAWSPDGAERLLASHLVARSRFDTHGRHE